MEKILRQKCANCRFTKKRKTAFVIGPAKYVKIYKNISEFSKIFQNFQKYFRIFKNISEFSKIFQNFQKYFRIFKNISKFSKIFQNFQKYFKIFKKLNIWYFSNLCYFRELKYLIFCVC